MLLNLDCILGHCLVPECHASTVADHHPSNVLALAVPDDVAVLAYWTPVFPVAGVSLPP